MRRLASGVSNRLPCVRGGTVGCLSSVVLVQFILLVWLANVAVLGPASGGSGSGIMRGPAFLRKLYYKTDVAHLMDVAGGGSETVGTAAGSPLGQAPIGAGIQSLTAEDPFVTKQLCYVFSDESEMCVYEGPVCVNNKEQILLGAPAEESRREAMMDDGRTRCLDYRYFERRDMCSYTGPFKRPNLPQSWYAKPLSKAQTDRPTSMPLAGRRFGPDDHASRMDAVPWDTLIALTDPRTGGLRNLPLAWQKKAARVDVEAAKAKAARLPGHIPRINSVRWVRSSAYIIPMEGGWLDHPWHWATATFPLWDAKLQNFTQSNVPLSDGSPGPLNYTTGGFFFPPMDFVVAQGAYMPYRYDLAELIPWAESLYPLLTQPQSRVMLNGNMAQTFNTSVHDYVCFTRGAVTGLKPRLFTSVGDAHAFKLMAYAAAGVKTPAHGAQPPRKITVLGRFSRGFADMPMILRVLQATGLPVRVVEDLRFLSWAEQVALMADTGILLAAHGGALANVMYMPMHAVVIEAFPYLTFFTMYQRLAQVASLQYYRLRGFRPPPRTDENGTVIDPWASYDDPEFVHDCEWPHHTSSVDAMLQRTCNGKTKVTPIAIDEGTFRAVLDMALDDIECKDSICRYDTGGRTFYKDMLTNETWAPMMVPGSSSGMTAEHAKEALKRSRGVSGRVWKPSLFS